MSRITGFEDKSQLPQKVLQMYEAVAQLMEEGADINNIRVSTITDRAGIGKGTAYDYFDTKEEIIACAILFQMRGLAGEIKRQLMGIESFAEQVAYLFDAVEKENIRQSCFLQFVHNLTDNSPVAELVRQRMLDKTFEEYSLWNLMEAWLKGAIAKGEVRDDLPMDYIIYTIFSKLVTYFAFCAMKDITYLDMEKVRPYARESILQELCKKNVKFSVDK